MVEVKVNTESLRLLQQRLYRVNGRLKVVDNRLDKLYLRSGLLDIWFIAQADFRISWSGKINVVANCLGDTANDFEAVENIIIKESQNQVIVNGVAGYNPFPKGSKKKSLIKKPIELLTYIGVNNLYNGIAGNFEQLDTEGKIDVIGASMMAEGKIWIDEDGNLCGDGSAEVKAFLLECQGKTSFKIAGVEFDAEGKAFIGAKAAAEAQFQMSEYGFNLSAKAEALAGASAEGGIGFKFGEGPFTIGAAVTGTAFAGAKASAEGEVVGDILKGNLYIAGKAGAFAGAEALIEPSITFGYIKTSCEMGVNTGIGGGVSGIAGIQEGHLKLELDLSLALFVGGEIHPKLDVDLERLANDLDIDLESLTNDLEELGDNPVEKLGDWINPFD